MCVICEGEYSIDDTELDCSNCPQLTTIPATLTNLTRLDCSNCPQLTTIPATLTKLTHLYCHNCPQLTAIPVVINLDESAYPHLTRKIVTLTPSSITYYLPYTETTISYCYHPQRVGGRLAKRDLALLF